MSEQEEFEFRARAEREFASTRGGAALGNPNLAAQGISANRGNIPNLGAVVADVGASGALGAVMGFASPEILQAAGAAAGAVPNPYVQTFGSGLRVAGNVLRGSRGAATVSGGLAGAGSEIAGKAVEGAGGGPVAAEAARIAGGGLTPEMVNLGKEAIKKWLITPSLSFFSKIKKDFATGIIEKLGGAPETLTDEELKFVKSRIAELRGGPKTDEPLEQVGSIMGAEGQRLVSEADRKLIAAQQQAAGLKPTGVQPELADIGESLQNAINTRHKAALEQRSKEYKNTQNVRDQLVSARESSNSFVNDLPEYKRVVAVLEAELDNSRIMNRSPEVQAGYRKILNSLTNPEQTEATRKLTLSGDKLDWQEVPGKPKPISFQALDDVRRKLGEAYRGKPAEGFEAIGEKAAKELYELVSDAQVAFAGGPSGPQRKMLDDYAARTEGLQIFSSKYGKKATALDQYREDAYVNDPSSLPKAYFKTRAGVGALRELVGNDAAVNNAALHYANRELQGKDSASVRKWMSDNSEWLSQTGSTPRIIERYADALEQSERGVASAQAFAKQAAADRDLLTRNALPAQRAVELIRSGNEELWAKVTPAVVQSPQAKQQMMNAVHQVIAEQATSKGTLNFFQRNLRPFLEQSQIATRKELDWIAAHLEDIERMALPEKAKLGIGKRLLLNSSAGWAASAAGRGTVWSAEKMVPE